MAETTPRTRLYCNRPLAPEHSVQLDEAVVHRIRSVLRLTAGDKVRLFNTDCGEWLCELTALGKKQAAAMPLTQMRQPEKARDDLWLMFAPLKKDATDMLVEKAVELGVDRLLPTTTQHTDIMRVNVERLTARSVAAAEQCERLAVPIVDAPMSLTQRLSDWPDGRVLIVCAEAGEATSMLDLAGRFAGQSVAIMIGPEGGIAKSELDGLAKLPFSHAAGLGPRVLRAETAAIAALAIWQTKDGVGMDRPPLRS